MVLWTASLCNSFACIEPKTYVTSYTACHIQISYESILSPLNTFNTGIKTVPRKQKYLGRKENRKVAPKKIHPRRKLLEEAPIHTQKAWLYSAVVPGLGQAYNKEYWKLPLIYGIFAGLTWGAIYNHLEYTTSKREFIENYKYQQKPKDSNLGNYLDGRKRDRTIFILAMGLWYLINVFDAYVGGTLKTFDVSDDLEIIVQPSEFKATPQGANIGLNISLRPKDEDRLSRLR